MGTSTTSRNQALDGLATPVNVLGYVQLNTADAGTTGANEMGSVTRQAATWNAAASGTKTNSGAMTFTTPGTNAATHFSTWSAVSAGTFGIGGNFASSATAVTITIAAGALTLSAT